jgi:hypothetical protein
VLCVAPFSLTGIGLPDGSNASIRPLIADPELLRLSAGPSHFDHARRAYVALRAGNFSKVFNYPLLKSVSETSTEIIPTAPPESRRNEHESRSSIRMPQKSTAEPEDGFCRGADIVWNWSAKSLGGRRELDKHRSIWWVDPGHGDTSRQVSSRAPRRRSIQ